MRMRFFLRSKFAVGLLAGFCLLAAIQKSLPLPDGETLSAAGESNRAFLIFKTSENKFARFQLSEDDTVTPGETPALKLIGGKGAKVLIIQDTYYSRPGGMSYCKAGKEEFLRVIALSRPIRQTLRLKLQSCRDNIELADNGLTWNPDSGTLQINWLNNPSSAVPRLSAKYQVGVDGQVKLISEKKRPTT